MNLKEKIRLWLQLLKLFPVVVLQRNSKKPCFKSWPHIHVSEADVRKAAQAKLNLGIRTDTLKVIDVDDIERARRFFTVHRKIAKILVRTRRGCHFYFKRSGNEGNRVGVNGEYDVRSGPGGYVVAPLSSVNGHTYTFVPGYANRWDELEEFTIADSPTGPQTPFDISGDMVFRARRYIQTLGPVVKGYRDSTCFRAACLLIQRFGLNQSAAWPLLLEFNERFCQPPLQNYKQLRRKLEEAERLKKQ